MAALYRAFLYHAYLPAIEFAHCHSLDYGTLIATKAISCKVTASRSHIPSTEMGGYTHIYIYIYTYNILIQVIKLLYVQGSCCVISRMDALLSAHGNVSGRSV